MRQEDRYGAFQSASKGDLLQFHANTAPDDPAQREYVVRVDQLQRQADADGTPAPQVRSCELGLATWGEGEGWSDWQGTTQALCLAPSVYVAIYRSYVDCTLASIRAADLTLPPGTCGIQITVVAISEEDEKDTLALMQRLCTSLYIHDQTQRIRARAMLCHVYHHALHDRWYEVRSCPEALQPRPGAWLPHHDRSTAVVWRGLVH